MIAIVNISDDKTALTGINKYQVRINRTVICEFEHFRGVGGLAQCLRDAAHAVDNTRNKPALEDILNILGLTK